jgi:hypothetical protein
MEHGKYRAFVIALEAQLDQRRIGLLRHNQTES